MAPKEMDSIFIPGQVKYIVNKDQHGYPQHNGEEYCQELKGVSFKARIQNPEDGHPHKPYVGQPEMKVGQLGAMKRPSGEAGKLRGDT